MKHTVKEAMQLISNRINSSLTSTVIVINFLGCRLSCSLGSQVVVKPIIILHTLDGPQKIEFVSGSAALNSTYSLRIKQLCNCALLSHLEIRCHNNTNYS